MPELEALDTIILKKGPILMKYISLAFVAVAGVVAAIAVRREYKALPAVVNPLIAD